MSDDRRSNQPPTFVLQAVGRMEPEEKRFLRYVGLALSAFCVVTPMVAELFISLWWGYWVFAAVGALSGFCFMFPALGMWLLTTISDRAERFIPTRVRAKVDELLPERRADRSALSREGA